jgi:hypothetical protein
MLRDLEFRPEGESMLRDLEFRPEGETTFQPRATPSRSPTFLQSSRRVGQEVNPYAYVINDFAAHLARDLHMRPEPRQGT